MTEPDTMTAVYRRLALALEADLEERELPAFGGTGDRFKVSNDRGLVVYSSTALGAWTAALEACQRRAAWRTMKARRKLERPAVVTLCRGPRAWDDDQPDGAA